MSSLNRRGALGQSKSARSSLVVTSFSLSRRVALGSPTGLD